MTSYQIKDILLAEQGMLNIELAEKRMPALLSIKERFKKEQPFKGLTIGMALHVTKETAVLVRTLIAGGAKVAISGCNPLSTQDDVAAALAKEGVNVYGHKGENKEDYYKFLELVLSHKPDLTIDDGCDLISLIHTKHKELLPKLIGGCEETTTGIIRLHAMVKDNALKYPIIAVNDNNTKHLLDNYYGTGQSTLDGIIRASNVLFSGKTVVVAGYGDCGKGVALRASAMGANVIVTEVNPFRALQAVLDGFRVMQMNDAAKVGDIFITVTGDRDVITLDHVKEMKDSAILANSGHFDNEIDVAALNKAYKKRRMRPSLEEYKVGNKSIYLCAEGRLVNLGAAEGHPSEVMSTSFCGQALACEYLVKNKGKLKSSVITLPESIDNDIALLQLNSMSVKIDTLTEAQKKYLASWEEGT
ncbi:MAG: adenosylhomocysteinase [Candidatus Micrarchaeota archaeon]|nr:adenosylhomocysteinase [Candidatus Micrarchaeota archaeon]